MPLTVEIRMFDPAGNRWPLPDEFISAWDFELLERGGCGTLNLLLMMEKDDLKVPVIPGPDWRFDFWMTGPAGTLVPVYRGWAEMPEATVAEGEPALRITGMGAMGREKSLLVDAVYVKPYGGDVSAFYGWLNDQFAADKVAGMGERLGVIVTVVDNNLGYTVERVDATGSDVRSARDAQAQAAANTLIWGWDFQADGRNRLWVKKRPTTITNNDYRFRVGKDVAYYSAPLDLAEVVNGIKLTGGAAKAPNLVYNASFEIPVSAGEGQPGNLLLDPSFELNNGSWTLIHTASIRTMPEGAKYARTGNNIMELDQLGFGLPNDGEGFQQKVALGYTATPGMIFGTTVHFAAESPSGNRSFWVLLECLDVSNTVVETLIDHVSPGVFTSRSYVEWILRVQLGAANTTTTQLRLTIELSTSSNPSDKSISAAMLDDIWLFRSDILAQDGWEQAKPAGSAASALIDWGRERDDRLASPAAYHGHYCLRACPVIGADDTDVNAVWLRPDASHWIAVRTATVYDLRVRYRSTVTVGIRLGLELQHQDKTITRQWGAETYTNSSGAWTPYAVDNTLVADLTTTLVRPIIEIRQNVAAGQSLDFDAIELMESAVDDRPNTIFVPGQNLELYCRSDNGERATVLDLYPAHANGLSTAAQASITTYGLRERTIRADQITDLASLMAYAVGYLNQQAAPKVQGLLRLDHPDVLVRHVAEDAFATPQGLVAIAGFQTSQPDIELGEYPSRIVYSLQPTGGFRCEVDLVNRRLDPALLLAAGKSSSSGGGGGSSSVPINSNPGGSTGVNAWVEESFTVADAGAFDGNADRTLGAGPHNTVTVSRTIVTGTMQNVYIERENMAPFDDWTVSGRVFTFLSGAAPQAGEKVRVQYAPV